VSATCLILPFSLQRMRHVAGTRLHLPAVGPDRERRCRTRLHRPLRSLRGGLPSLRLPFPAVPRTIRPVSRYMREALLCWLPSSSAAIFRPDDDDSQHRGGTRP